MHASVSTRVLVETFYLLYATINSHLCSVHYKYSAAQGVTML